MKCLQFKLVHPVAIIGLMMGIFAFVADAQVGAGKEPGEIREIGGLSFVWCPAGTVRMGSPIAPAEIAKDYGGRPEWYSDEYPQREVEAGGYWLSQTEITREQWLAVANTRPWGDVKGDEAQGPATGMTWEEAVGFAREFSKLHECSARLPLEAEWEHACRAGSDGVFPFGNDVTQLGLHAQFRLNAPDGVAQGVKQRGANAWNLHDLLGNAWEWCQDKYGAVEGSGARNASASLRVIRGGAANSTAAFLRCSYRTGLPLDTRSPRLGLRLLVEPSSD